MTDFNTILELESQIATLEAKRDELLKDADPNDILRARVQDVFNRFPVVESVGWVQYVPYFNDGDPCTWTVYGPGFNIRTEEEVEATGEDYYPSEEIDIWGFEYAFGKNYDNNDPYYANIRARYPGVTQEMALRLLEALKEVGSWVLRSESYLNGLFGHSSVIMRRDGTVSVEEYAHD